MDNKINTKINSGNVAELDRYFSPNGYVVDSLPAEKSVRDNTEVYLQKSSGTYDVYKMLKGKWVLLNQNTSTVEQVVTLQKTGGSGVDYSSTIAANTADITTNASNIATNASDISDNADDIAALGNTAPAYVKTAVDYNLPSANSIDGKILAIKNTGTQIIEVQTEAAEKIDGELIQHVGPDDCLMIMSDGSDWIIV
jgi:hypothetical protein